MLIQAHAPIFLARVERKEHRFIERSAGHVDGLVILGRLVAPPWAMQQHPIPGLADPDLIDAARRAGIDFLVDPDTWPLPEARSRDDHSVGRSVRLGAAEVVQLPLSPDQLADPELRQIFVRASMADQAHALMPAAPYFRFSSQKDPWLRVNLDCIRMLVELRGIKPVAAFVMCTLEALADGTLELAAARYAAVLPPGSIALMGVADLRPDSAELALLSKYLRAVAAFANAGLAPIADRVGEFGPATIPFGARGCARGTRLYRHTPPKATFTTDINPKMRLKWLAPGTAQRLPVAKATARVARGTIERCPELRKCVTLRLTIDPVHVRLHDAHLHRYELQRAAQRGAAGQAAQWRRRKLKMLARWAQAIDDAAARSAEA
ncbi:MAG: hypothetical protein ACRDLN_00790 [Solirubrobacteraceae bacterium]